MRIQIIRGLTISALAAGLLVPVTASSQAAAHQAAVPALIQADIDPATVEPAPSATTPGAAAAPQANATCKINMISINRFSECEWVTLRLKVIRIVNGVPQQVGTATFTARHTMTLHAKSADWEEKFQLSKATTTGDGKGITVSVTATAGNGTSAKTHYGPHLLDTGSGGSVTYTTAPMRKGRINGKTQTRYAFQYTKPGHVPGSTNYPSATWRCDNYYGTSGCAMTDQPTAVSMVGIPWIDDGIRTLRARGGHYGDPNGGKPLHWMINTKQKNDNRRAVCGGRTAPPDMKRVGRTYCDEYPFASTYEGGTKLPASQRETTWVSPNENNTQGARITNWRRPMHVMDHDAFYVIV
ncbi:NucA/NucB deoxyribonuclease domain-containing protein [Streptomyces sp. NPDC001691]|uniref:NucA/NucB deoxyribonuclease domain-containing protein n=1 Tax=Streptomyces sp. NPDC001691 TaxID=3364600 RepID=UPI0036C5CC3B